MEIPKLMDFSAYRVKPKKSNAQTDSMHSTRFQSPSYKYIKPVSDRTKASLEVNDLTLYSNIDDFDDFDDIEDDSSYSTGTKIFDGRVTIDKLVAEGAQAKFYSAFNEDNEIIGVKSYCFGSLTSAATKAANREFAILKSLDHPNIVKYLDFETVNGECYTIFNIAMEFIDGMTLKEKISRSDEILEDETKRILVQMLEAVAYMDQESVIHRDLKPDNIMLDSFENVKIIDFGLSIIHECENFQMTTTKGTPNYMAPELIHNKSFTTKCDVWSIGCVLYELVTGKPPLDGMNQFSV